MALNVTTALIGGGCQRAVASPSLAQWDRGQILKITGVDLPVTYNVEFCCQGDLTTTTMLGGADGVEIPNLLLQRGLPIIAYLVLHEGQDDRETEYWITIYVKQRAMPPSVTPDPEQADIIDQLVAALNEGVTAAENAAAQAEAQVEHYPTVIDGTWHVWNALTESWVDTEVPATGPAGRGITSVTQNADYTLTLTFTDGTDWTTPTPVRGATGATPNLTIGTVTTGAAGSSAAVSISGTAENPVLSLTIPQGLKGDPGNGDAIAPTFSASTAYPAGAYVIYNGSLYRFTAAHAAGAWVGTDAVAAVLGNDVAELKGDFDDAVTILNQQINSKAPVIIDTASGSIASFADGADGMPVKSLVCQVNPQQDLHGYDSPWPAGGGKNLFDKDNLSPYNNVYVRGSDKVLVAGSGNFGFYIPCKSGETYTISVVNKNATDITAGSFESVPALNAVATVRVASSASESAKSITITTGTNDTYLFVKYNNTNATQTYTNDQILAGLQIELGSTATAYTPYSNECPITGFTGLTVNRIAKYYFNAFEASSSGITRTALNNGKTIHIQGTATSGSAYTISADFVPESESLTIFDTPSLSIIGRGFCLYDVTASTFIGDYFKSGEAVTRAVNKTHTYRLGFEMGGSQYVDITITPRIADTESYIAIPVSWQDSAGTVYGGNIELATGVMTVDRAYQLLNDTTKWISFSETLDVGYNETFARKKYSDSYTGLLCTIAKAEQQSGIYCRWSGATTGVFGFKNISPLTLDDIKTMASNNQIAICYPIELVTVQLDPVIVSTLLGENNIWHDANGDISVEYCADTKLYLEKLTQPTEDDMIANANIAANKFFMIGNTLYFSTAAIAQGATIVPGTNCNKVSLADALNTLNA